MLKSKASQLFKAPSMRERKLQTRRLRASIKDFAYIVAFCFVFLGLFKSVSTALSQTHPVETVEAVSKQLIEVPTEKEVIVEKVVEKDITTEGQPLDVWVGEAADKFFRGGQASEVRMVMHCLLSRESLHGQNKGFGDGGAAGGPLQFHESTWTRMRTQMMADGYTKTMGNRLDMHQAIETTVYAIFKGWGKEWGPLFRAANNAGWAECPKPSWL